MSRQRVEIGVRVDLAEVEEVPMPTLAPLLPAPETLPAEPGPARLPPPPDDLHTPLLGAIAALLAMGKPMAQTAKDLGMSRTTLWRLLKAHPGLRDQVEQERQVRRLDVAHKLDTLTDKAVQTIERRLLAGDAKVAMWLLDRRGAADFAIAGLPATGAARLQVAGTGNAPLVSITPGRNDDQMLELLPPPDSPQHA